MVFVFTCLAYFTWYDNLSIHLNKPHFKLNREIENISHFCILFFLVLAGNERRKTTEKLAITNA